MKLEARLTHNAVLFDKDTDSHLVISLTAPTIDTEQVRPKLALVLCFDVSGSMQGTKLEYAQQSAYKVIEHLKADDYLGIVAFGSNVTTVTKPARVGGNKDALRKAVASLQIQGMTNFSGGMIQSLELLKELDLGSNYLHRVIMLTDGAANCGPEKTPEGILRLLNANRDHITCSAFGYGAGVGEFDSGLLTEFAKQGDGNYAHIENPDLALKAFGSELGGLISTYATGIRIELKALAGHSIERVISDVDVDEEITGELYINIPDLLAEEARHIVVAVKLAKQATSGPRAVNVFEAKVSYQTFDALGKREVHATETKGRIRFVKKEAVTNPDLDTIVGLAQLVRAQLEAEGQAKLGNFAAAASLLTAQAQAFNSSGLGNLAAAASKTSGMLSSHASYNASQGYLRSFERGATRGLGVSCYAGGSDVDLALLGAQMTNSVTTSTSNAFTSAVDAVRQDPDLAVAIHPDPAPVAPDLSIFSSFTVDPTHAILNTPPPDWAALTGGSGGWSGVVSSTGVADWVAQQALPSHMAMPPLTVTAGVHVAQPLTVADLTNLTKSPPTPHETSSAAKADSMKVRKSRSQSRKSW